MPACQPASRNEATAKFRWVDQVCTDLKVGHLACRVASLMVRYFNAKEGCAWPSQKRLADAAGVTVRSVQNALKALARRGHLSIRKRGGRVNRYQYKLANDASPPASGQANGRSESGERRFAQYQETPLKRAKDDRADFGPQLLSLAAELAKARSGVPSRGIVK